MLLITRRTNESIVINDNIEVTVVEVRGGRVKLGFEFPEGNTVYRKELYLKIQEENKTAASSQGDISKLLSSIKNKE
ncbi:MAG: carbon storage regulator CsrA [Pseudomonadota bacterium]|mgnify:FL=1|nr:carbon storage regulator [Magnetococcales bacterium]MEC8067190.1 carbon storage regulator CsrA [Pseudomonadota bacterium]MEC8467774.1 carbon storage regulator CsrA [Pseudomonadota bacterium]|tara:strand:+ start:21566 stop:21796 length:231 start_codon:yes stop_codon:yes gene_type:complete